ncbi:hypothetical protein JCM10207_005234 [Rhodosporidiobolus poonsookiae]
MAYDDSTPSRGRGRGRGRGGSGGRGGAPSRGGARGQSNAQQGMPGTIPSGSVSKLKAQLRQTKRLLARDDLTPDVRTTSERRLVSLEAELAKAEQGNLEKKMVSRYRGVKFFERQKLLRKIKQTKKQLVALPDDEKLKTALLEARIDLHYVLRYPKLDKYIALFPDGSYVPHFASPSSSSAAAAPTDAETKRASLRAAIRKQIKQGEIPEEAEGGDLGIEGEEDVGAGPAGGKRERGGDDEEQQEEEEEEAQPVEQPKGKRRRVEQPVEEEPVEEEAAEEDAPAAALGGKKLNRKQRKEKKRAEAAAFEEPTSTPAKGAAKEKGKKGKSASEAKEDKKALADEDDFFA